MASEQSEEQSSSSRREVKNGGQVMTPVFCTVTTSRVLLAELLSKGQETPYASDERYRSLVVLNSTSTRKVLDTTKYMHTVDELLHPETETFESPFIGWNNKQVYDFVKSHIRGPEKKKENHLDRIWTFYTFVVVDSQSAEDSTALLLTDGPDLGEGENEVILKAARVSFDKLATMLQTVETLVGTLSEHAGGFGQAISQYPQAILEPVEGEANVFRIRAEDDARRSRRIALIQAEEEGMLSQEKMDFAKSIRVE